MTIPLAAVILAAGQGTRMRSKLPKVLHHVAGKPMIAHVLDAVAQLSQAKSVIVLGHGADAVRRCVGTEAQVVVQEPQLGTAHAVLQARPHLGHFAGDVLVLYGDTPLLRPETVAMLLDHHRETRATVTILSAVVEDTSGYGRIVRGPDGEVVGIVEESAADEQQRAIKEINSGVYCFDGSWLWQSLDRVECNAKGEYYLTDLAAIARHDGRRIAAIAAGDPMEAMGVNTRVQLADAEQAMRQRVRERLMLSGVTMLDPASTYVDASAQIGRDTVLYPNTLVEGPTVIGDDCVIGPSTHLINARIGDGCRVVASLIEDSALAERVVVGPFSHLRAGAAVGSDAQIGNYAEIKKSTVGAGTKMHHFSYLGDALVGRDVNVGAGTITCNFDSESGVKSQTIIEDEAALGSDTMLVAPVRVGRGATTGAGSVVTRDLPEDALAFGVPAKVARKVRRPPRQVEEGGRGDTPPRQVEEGGRGDTPPRQVEEGGRGGVSGS